jgi:Holliday junction resolvase RusA-like endonuclease
MARKKKHTVHYSVRPQVKQRPRMTRRGKAYTPMRTHLAEDVIREGWDGPCFSGPVSMEVEFSKNGSVVTVGILEGDEYDKTVLRGDIDNYLKLVMDGLNGAAYEDDSQIRLVIAKKL